MTTNECEYCINSNALYENTRQNEEIVIGMRGKY